MVHSTCLYGKTKKQIINKQKTSTVHKYVHVCNQKLIFIHLNKNIIYVVGILKKCLNEMVLLSFPTKHSQYYMQNFSDIC